MRRVDIVQTFPGEDEKLVAGIVLFEGELICAEGNETAVENTLREPLNVSAPGEIIQVFAREDPEAWLENAGMYGSGYTSFITDEYGDDDALYDPDTGRFIGNDEEEPL